MLSLIFVVDFCFAFVDVVVDFVFLLPVLLMVQFFLTFSSPIRLLIFNSFMEYS